MIHDSLETALAHWKLPPFDPRRESVVDAWRRVGEHLFLGLGRTVMERDAAIDLLARVRPKFHEVNYIAFDEGLADRDEPLIAEIDEMLAEHAARYPDKPSTP